MKKMGKRFAYSTLGLAIALTLLGCAGGAINWNQEPPYSRSLAWGEKGSGPGQFNDPTGIAVTADEVYIADARNSRIQVFDKQGKFRRAFGGDILGRPMNMDIAGNRLYVPDYFKDVIHVFTLAGEYCEAIKTDDGLTSPGGLAVRDDGTLLIADTYGQRVVHLAPDGEVLRSWAGTGIGAGDFNYPTDIAIAPDGGFYVADGYNDRIQQFDPDGEFVRKWGGPFAMNIYGPFKGWFTTVTSVAVGLEGSVYAADFYNDRIQKFTAEGDYLTTFGSEPASAGHTAMAVAVDNEGTVWSVNFADNRVEKWQPD